MVSFVLALAALTLPPSIVSRRCEEHGPRLDGTMVTVCNGTVVRVRDHLGNEREWKDGGRTVILRSPATRSIVLAPPLR
jgi:hypothetical protein